MSESVLKHRPAANLGVAIVAPDAARLATLRTIVLTAGHRVVEENDADVVLVDGESMTDRPALVLGARSQGQAGWLSADASAEQIDAALRAVAVGLVVRTASEPNQDGFEELPERAAAQVLLTPRELDVLAAIGSGLSNKQIARQLRISLHTVKFHIESLFRKLGARTRAEAVAKGLERRVKETVEL
jgi:DNA-binding NarL/FixJ family response regulator